MPDQQHRITFPDISSRAFEHPADRSALVALRSLSGFDTVLKTLSGLFRERQHRLLYLASAIKVDERQFAGVNALLTEVVGVLDAPARPELFVVQDPRVNAITMGMDEPFIVLTTGMVDLMDTDELRFVIGHEVGHAMSGHSVYRTMLHHLLNLVGAFSWMPIGSWGLRALVASLNEWARKSELSGDRAGLLAGQDEQAALRVMMKLAGGPKLAEMNTEAFLEQAAEYESTGDLRDGLLKLINLEPQTHPFSVVRAAALKEWVDSGDYQRILAGNYPRRTDDKKATIGEEFAAAGKSYRKSFNESTDPLVSAVRNLGHDVGGVAQTVGKNIVDVVTGIWNRFDGRDESEPRTETTAETGSTGAAESGPAEGGESTEGGDPKDN